MTGVQTCALPISCDFFAHNEDGSSVGEDIFARGLCLPSDIKNTDEETEAIIRTVKALF